MFDNLDSRKKGLYAIFIALLLVNLAFFYMLLSNLHIPNDSFYNFEDLGLILSSIIIFAFISSKLPRLRRLGDSSLYDVSYFLILALITLFISYYNAAINEFLGLGLFLDMFNILAISLIFMIVAIHLKTFKAIIAGDKSRNKLIFCSLIFSILGILASLSLFMGDVPANVRTMTILIGSMFGGPIVGIPSAILSSLFRFTLGGATALPCAISTVVCGFIGSAVYILNGRKFLNSSRSAVLMFLIVGLEMFFILVLVPFDRAIPLVCSLYPPMLFGSVIGIVLFKLVIKDSEESSKVKRNLESEVDELKQTVKEHEEKITNLESLLKEK